VFVSILGSVGVSGRGSGSGSGAGGSSGGGWVHWIVHTSAGGLSSPGG
jgi:hypothetical protein